MTPPEGKYEAAERFTIAEVPGLRVRMLALGAGQSVPWHCHTEISDRLICIEGPIGVRLRDPEEVCVLTPGSLFVVAPGWPHSVGGEDRNPCRFLAVRGGGAYDYIALPGEQGPPHANG